MRRLFKVCVRVFCARNAAILLVYILAKIKMNFIWKDDLYSKIGTFCKSLAGPLSEAKTHWMVGQLTTTPEPIGLCMASYQDLYAKYASIISPAYQLLWTTVNWWCWWRFTHTFCYSSNIFGAYTLFLAFHTLVYRWGCQFLSLFFTRQRTYGDDGASLLKKSACNFRTHPAILPWFSK